MDTKKNRLLAIVFVIFICMYAGGIVLESAIAGIITFISLVALIESISFLKWLISHTSKLVDFSIFVFAVYAKIHFGVTIAIGIMFAGLMFTLLYAPYIREIHRLNSKTNQDEN
jgi:hypothetical protein